MTRLPRQCFFTALLFGCGCLLFSFEASAEHKKGGPKNADAPKNADVPKGDQHKKMDHPKGESQEKKGHHHEHGGHSVAPAPPVAVKPTLPAPGRQQPPQPGAVDPQLKRALDVLQKTGGILQRADHDYGGHRAHAVHGINQAEQQLQLALGMQASGPAPHAKLKTAMPEPQNLSNAQLREAIPVLQEAIGWMKTSKHDYAGHRTNSVRDLENAVKQLQKALAYQQANPKTEGKKP